MIQHHPYDKRLTYPREVLARHCMALAKLGNCGGCRHVDAWAGIGQTLLIEKNKNPTIFVLLI